MGPPLPASCLARRVPGRCNDHRSRVKALPIRQGAGATPSRREAVVFGRRPDRAGNLDRCGESLAPGPLGHRSQRG